MMKKVLAEKQGYIGPVCFSGLFISVIFKIFFLPFYFRNYVIR